MKMTAVQVQMADGLPISARAQGTKQLMDPFAQIIANMAAQMQEQPSNEDAVIQPLPPKQSKDAVQAELGAMLFPMLQIPIEQLPMESLGATPQQVTVSPTTFNPVDAIPQAEILLPAPVIEQVTAVMKQVMGQTAQAGERIEYSVASGNREPLGILVGAKGMGLELPAAQYGQLPEARSQQGDTKQLFMVQRQFRDTVDAVKSRLQKQQDPAKTEEVYVDQLQSQVDSQKTLAGIAVKKAEAPSVEPKLLEQLQTGIAEKLQKGESEFILRLKPEALGEITVKLIEKAGKTTLSIVTASSQTAKLINGDLAVLREVLRPMQVEVKEAVQHTVEANRNGLNFEFSGEQRFTDGRQSFGGKQPVYYADTEIQQAQETVPEQPLAGESYIMI